MESQRPSRRLPLPHQTGVAERSIGGDDGRAARNVVDDVVITHLANGIGARLAVDANRHDHISIINSRLGAGDEVRREIGMKHALVDIHPRENRRKDGQNGSKE